MEIPKYDNLPRDQQSHYLTWLVNGAAQALDANNNHDQSVKLLALFKPIPNSPLASPGRTQFFQGMSDARAINQQNMNDKTFVPLQVEDVLAAVLDQNGISINPNDLFTIGKTYKPDLINKSIDASK